MKIEIGNVLGLETERSAVQDRLRDIGLAPLSREFVARKKKDFERREGYCPWLLPAWGITFIVSLLAMCMGMMLIHFHAVSTQAWWWIVPSAFMFLLTFCMPVLLRNVKVEGWTRTPFEIYSWMSAGPMTMDPPEYVVASAERIKEEFPDAILMVEHLGDDPFLVAAIDGVLHYLESW